MSRWQRPSLTPVPWRQAAADRLRRTDPRRIARHVLVTMVALLLAQLGWQWRSTTVELGQRQSLVVMERAISAGEIVTPNDVRLVPWPIGLAPDGAATALPPGAIAAADLAAGEVLITQRLFPTSEGINEGELLVTIPQPLAPPPVSRGSRIDLFGILPIGEGLTSPAHRLATGTVIVVTESAISVAVDNSAVPSIVEHLTLGTIEVVIRP